ncbi:MULTISPECIES: winged helix-turn-helix domain-containing protein [Asticcacaulis]|jgi:DNA-binding MarR family transcriptional regulator|uniref:Regulatory protein, ArsR n=2 Tax=Asticcacaulis TaxID=76890 RepID=A0A3G9G095_9CAUL|nr:MULTISPECIES: transcriptional regulator [Asticcacaulis]MCA1934817.1 transcriptional regulator [Asticcacaulis sp.]MDC7695810.1 transcriptional regulator [Asticcacaulis currens]BBF80710.1 regulatory protein, ArsR [Asticcacaulis excentricus]BEV11254.1 transcriptional regulator [Asticcacaulis sp. DW145]
MPDEFNIERIDDVIHGRLRLGIMAFLSTAGSADFTTLKAKTQSTDGNLSVQVRKLEEANYVTVDKAFVGKKPVTTITLTEAGRAAFVDYLDAMRRLIDEAG